VVGQFAVATDRWANPDVNRAFELRQAAFYQAMGAWNTRSLVSDFEVVLFRAGEQSWGEHIDFEHDYGWRHYVKGPLHVVPVSGDHLGIIKPPNVSKLAQQAQQYLNRKGPSRA
jgi:thioesterase domain-containing protein